MNGTYVLEDDILLHKEDDGSQSQSFLSLPQVRDLGHLAADHVPDCKEFLSSAELEVDSD